VLNAVAMVSLASNTASVMPLAPPTASVVSVSSSAAPVMLFAPSAASVADVTQGRGILSALSLGVD
jgi:hypothetical protein